MVKVAVSPLIFLGAGASVPFGVPTMKQMVTLFEQELASIQFEVTGNFKADMIKLYASIKNSLIATYGYADLESVFSVIDILAADKKYSELGFATNYILSRIQKSYVGKDTISNPHEKALALELLEQFKKFVRAKCTIDESKFDLIDSIYSDFFNKLGKKYNADHVVAPNGNSYHVENWSIYTTNYDLSQEIYWEGLADTNDLFNERAGAKVLAVDRVGEQDKPKIVKLHGSLN